MAILFVLGIASYRSYQRRQYLEAAVKMVKVDLSLARELALAGKTKCSPGTLRGYLFRVYPDPDNKYRVGADCGPGNTCVNNLSLCEKEVILPDGVKIDPIGLGNVFTFQTLAGGIDRSSNVTITLTFLGMSRNITVDLVGKIY